MCLDPRLIQNKKYVPNKKNGGIVPRLTVNGWEKGFDKRVLAVPVGCGRCIECRKQEKRKWQTRLLEDVKTNKNGHFITLTFSNESIAELNKEIDESYRGYERDNKIATVAVRRYLERWRKKHKKSLRHWLVTELGHNGTENIHLHGIVWTDQPKEEVEKHWQYGYIWAGGKERTYVNGQTVNYIVKYIGKEDFEHKEYKPKILTSAGIGRNYTETFNAKKNKYKAGETREYYKTSTGHKMAMPMYWRNKIYTEDEREKLWIEKLDKKTRWVLGREIDISKGEEGYYAWLEVARQKNERLGYGNKTVDWNRKQYEEDRRTMLLQERISRAEENGLPEWVTTSGRIGEENEKYWNDIQI